MGFVRIIRSINDGDGDPSMVPSGFTFYASDLSHFRYLNMAFTDFRVG